MWAEMTGWLTIWIKKSIILVGSKFLAHAKTFSLAAREKANLKTCTSRKTYSAPVTGSDPVSGRDGFY